MNNEFTILITCLCTVTTIVVVMFINTTCAFQEKLDEQEEIIKSEKIIHRKREEEQERKFLKKQVDYEKKLERAFALIETCNSKINELVLLNKESANKQQTENMIYCNKMHCQILARQDDESERCTELFQEIQTINIKHAEQATIRSKSYITFCAIVPNFGTNEKIFQYINDNDYGVNGTISNTHWSNWCYKLHMFISNNMFGVDGSTHTRIDNDVLNNKIYIFDDIEITHDQQHPHDYNKVCNMHNILNIINRHKSSNLKVPTLVCDEIRHTNPCVIPIGSVLSGEISTYFPENTYVVNYLKDALYVELINGNQQERYPHYLKMTTVILSNNRIKKYPVSLYEKVGDEVNLRDKCYIDGSFI